jgi:hypothetical protein
MGRRKPIRMGLGEGALGEALRWLARGSHEEDKGVGLGALPDPG